MEPWTLGCLGKAVIVLVGLALAVSIFIAVSAVQRVIKGRRNANTSSETNASGSQSRTAVTSPENGSIDALSHLTLENTVLWQGPALALAAEAFLLTIALGRDTANFARVLSSFLAAVTAGAACYLVYRKGVQVRALKGKLDLKEPNGPRASTIWIIALTLFVLADAAVIWIVWCGDPNDWL
jgi:hypothetical protein